MKILHIASFLGNIGDNFNHLGTRKLLESKLGKIQWFELEIREPSGRIMNLITISLITVTHLMQ